MFGYSLFGHEKKRRVPALNTTSTADISFMLLIFFLVTTSMDADKGISRELPPYNEKTDNAPTNVSESKTLKLYIDKAGKLFCNDHPQDMATLSDSAEAVIAKDGKNHVISIRVDRQAEYDIYFHVQNELVAAYRKQRDKKALAAYGEKFDDCGPNQKKSILEAVPQRISETYEITEEDR